MATITISLPDSLREFVDRQVETRGYGNVSEYFRSLLREAQQHEADKRLEELLLTGISSDDGTEITPASVSAMTERLLKRIGKRKRTA